MGGTIGENFSGKGWEALNKKEKKVRVVVYDAARKTLSLQSKPTNERGLPFSCCSKRLDLSVYWSRTAYVRSTRETNS